ncbi:MAG: TetR/AcrR family transcriptional regulator [Caulobacteraceae bacterium]|nr:TetR/AcrR family transcriptional regulator [Caulobacteraceae bacterium]
MVARGWRGGPDRARDDPARSPLPDFRRHLSGRGRLNRRRRMPYRAAMTYDAQETDRRIRRTRAAISEAFIRLMFSRRYDAIRTADLIAEAGVGRSTFYEHFRNKDEVLVAVIDPLFAPLADAAVGRGDVYRLQAILAHLWEQRSLGRMLFASGLLDKLQRKLAAMIAARMDEAGDEGPTALIAAGAAAGQLAMLKQWMTGEVSCPTADLARLMARRTA